MRVIFSGSGLALYAYIGVLKALEELKVEITEGIGISGGAFVLGLHSGGYSAKEICQIATTLRLQDYLDWSWNPIKDMGLLKGNKIAKLLDRLLPNSFERTLYPLTIGTTNLYDKKPVYYNSWITPSYRVSKAIRKSISLPIIFKPIKTDKWLIEVDGGVYNNFPIDYYGANDQDVIGFYTVTKDRKPKEIKNVIDLIFAVIEAFMRAIEKEHIEDVVYAKLCPIQLKYNSLHIPTRKEIDDMIYEGYVQAKRHILTLKG